MGPLDLAVPASGALRRPPCEDSFEPGSDADGSQETASAGEVCHWPAGHTGVSQDGVTFIEIGPTARMREFSEHAKTLFS